MDTIQYIFIGSALTLIILLILFRVEDTRGQKIILSNVRNRSDRILRYVSQGTQNIYLYIGRGAARQTTHFFVHKMLQNALRFIKRCERFLRKLQYKNRVVAHAEQSDDLVDARMQAVQEHAATIKLPMEERREKRRELLK